MEEGDDISLHCRCPLEKSEEVFHGIGYPFRAGRGYGRAYYDLTLEGDRARQIANVILARLRQIKGCEVTEA